MENKEKFFEEIISKLEKERRLSEEEYLFLVENRNERFAKLLAERARAARERVYGKEVYVRALIEISNICKNDCLYCGIRRSNEEVKRYRLTEEEILALVKEGTALGFQTFVLQGGEDGYYTDEKLVTLIKEIKKTAREAALTLSLGERRKESYERLFLAGADRYLLRHESINPCHYEYLHPKDMSHKKRLEALNNLKEIGYQVGSGFMVGSPGQTARDLAKEMKFIEKFRPDMCGIGPFIPHHATPFKDEGAGSVDLTCYLISIMRLIDPELLIPATTALGSLEDGGREKGILAGANVVMPNLSPKQKRADYQIYDNKLSAGAESAEMLDLLKEQIKKTGYEVVMSRGDNPKFRKTKPEIHGN